MNENKHSADIGSDLMNKTINNDKKNAELDAVIMKAADQAGKLITNYVSAVSTTAIATGDLRSQAKKEISEFAKFADMVEQERIKILKSLKVFRSEVTAELEGIKKINEVLENQKTKDSLVLMNRTLELLANPVVQKLIKGMNNEQ